MQQTTHQHYRPFDCGQYMASAPIDTLRPGGKPHILQVTDKALFGKVTAPDGEEQAQKWSLTGSAYHDQNPGPRDLVMLPLFYIDDKPVFTGDEIMNDGGHIVKASPAHDNVARMWKWPPTVRTKMTATELLDLVEEINKTPYNGVPGIGYVDLANAVLARAVADGQLIHATHFWSTAGGTVYGSQAAVKEIERRFTHGVTPEKHNEAVAALKTAGFRYSELHGWAIAPEHKHRTRDAFMELACGTIYGERHVLDDVQKRLHAWQGISPDNHAAIVREAIRLTFASPKASLSNADQDEIMVLATKQAAQK